MFLNFHKNHKNIFTSMLLGIPPFRFILFRHSEPYYLSPKHYLAVILLDYCIPLYLLLLDAFICIIIPLKLQLAFFSHHTLTIGGSSSLEDDPIITTITEIVTV